MSAGNTDCRKCKSPMPAYMQTATLGGSGPLANASFTTTAYACPKCGHWNDLKKRKAQRAQSGGAK